jgi:hypothetical protein
METLAQSFEVREGATPVSVQSDTASLTIPQADLPRIGQHPCPMRKRIFVMAITALTQRSH